jgi:uncharacterized protein YraI
MRKYVLWVSLIVATTLSVTGVGAQAQIRIVVNRDFVNLRLVPALGATVVGTANAGTTFTADARTADNAWLRVNFGGSEAWISTVVITVLDGNAAGLPVRDPRTIPFGGPDAPRAGFTDQTSEIVGRLTNTGVRIRTGPSIAYRELANAPRFSALPLLGRTADSQWVQVNFEGVLGWAKAEFFEVLGGRTITELPIGGIVASEPPLEDTDQNDLFGTLRLMRERLDFAQVALNQQRQVWTDAALGVAPACGGYPSRPSDFNVPTDLLQRYFPTLNPLVEDFNEAAANIRAAIDLQIDVCQEPGAAAVLLSTPVVTGGLEFVNDADVQVASLRRRLDELIPEIGPDECVFEFAGRVDVLEAFPTSLIVQDEFEPDDLAIGYCFDASPIVLGYLELVREPSNYEIVVAIAPLENPADFIAADSAGPSDSQTTIILRDIQFPFEGRYLLVLAASVPDGSPPQGQYAFTALDIIFGSPTGNLLAFDDNGNVVTSLVPVQLTDGTVIFEQQSAVPDTVVANPTATNTTAAAVNVYIEADLSSAVVGQLAAGQSTPVVSTIEGWVQIQLTPSVIGWVEAQNVSVDSGVQTDSTVVTGNVSCPGVFLTCNDLITCSEVQACINDGSTLLDPNGNGLACDANEGNPPLGCSVAAPVP